MFTAHERRIFELSKDEKGPEAEALRKMIDNFPWLTLVAEYKFDTEVSKAAVQWHAAQVQMKIAIEQYEAKKKQKGEE